MVSLDLEKKLACMQMELHFISLNSGSGSREKSVGTSTCICARSSCIFCQDSAYCRRTSSMMVDVTARPTRMKIMHKNM